jgi:hypothetical protein
VTQSIDRSVFKTTTDQFKRHFRDYLRALAKDDNDDRVELIQQLEWCFDRWEYWRQRFFPDADLTFPFFQSGRRGAEFGHYSTIGDSGQPSVIHIKRSLLMGTSDLAVYKITPTKKLVLKADHPERIKFVDQVILHELVHQYLHEGAPPEVIRKYEDSESGTNHKGHGSLFAAECNRINEVLHPELGFEFIPVRHVKRDRGPLADRQRPSCAQFTHGELLFAWSPTDEKLTPEQLEDNRQRMEQALRYYGGAIEVVQEAEEVETDFSAPFDTDCGDVCIQHLKDFDKANGTKLELSFYKSVLTSLKSEGMLEAALKGVGQSAAPVNIQPVERQEPAPEPFGKLDQLLREIWEPTRGDVVNVDGYGEEAFVVADLEGEKVYLTRADDPSRAWLGPVSDSLVCKAATVPPMGDNFPSLTEKYPLSDCNKSSARLKTAIRESGLTKADFARQHFGHKNGEQLSRHLKKLSQRLDQAIRIQLGEAA